MMQQLQMGSHATGPGGNAGGSAGAGPRKSNMSNQLQPNQQNQQPYIITKQMNLVADAHVTGNKKPPGLQAQAPPLSQHGQQNANMLLNTQPVKHGHPQTINMAAVSQTPQIIMNKQNLMAQTYAQMQVPQPAQQLQN